MPFYSGSSVRCVQCRGRTTEKCRWSSVAIVTQSGSRDYASDAARLSVGAPKLTGFAQRTVLSSVCLVGVSLSGRLSGDTESQRDVVPGPAVCPREDDGLPQAGIIGAYCLSRRGDLAEVVGVFDLGGGWVQRVGEPLEPSGGLLDFLVSVSGHRRRRRAFELAHRSASRQYSLSSVRDGRPQRCVVLTVSVQG